MKCATSPIRISAPKIRIFTVWGYSVGQTIKFDIDSGAFSEELAMLTGGIYIYTECLKRKYCTVESDTQFLI